MPERLFGFPDTFGDGRQEIWRFDGGSTKLTRLLKGLADRIQRADLGEAVVRLLLGNGDDGS